jgi:ubiquinone/menaquinone biosynthesis C-methylase UbiE
LIQKGINYTKSTATWLANGKHTTSEAQVAQRLAICEACPSLIRESMTCAECGCPLANKAARNTSPGQSDCPLGKWPALSKYAPPGFKTLPTKGRVLLRFNHGLGDAVQLTVALRHLRHYLPELEVDVVAPAGRETVLRAVCQPLRLGQAVGDYDHVIRLHWGECHKSYADQPSTKIQWQLEEWGLPYRPELGRYLVTPSPEAQALAAKYIAGRRIVLLHNTATSNPRKKLMPDDLFATLCETVRLAGYDPVVLDWKGKCAELSRRGQCLWPGPDHWLWPKGGDGETIVALAQQAALCIGIDSGPGHCFAATDTPTIIWWREHHPVHYFPPAPNVHHCVPLHHAQFLRPPVTAGEQFFLANYQHHFNLVDVVQRTLAEGLPAGKQYGLVPGLKATTYDHTYYAEHKAAGLDYLAYGEWQQQYGRWFVDSLGLKRKRVLDVGCACGAIARGLHEAGAIVQGIDVNDYMIRLGHATWPDIDTQVADAVTLPFPDASFDCIHTAQVAEHFQPDQVPRILSEFRRVLKPGGLLFCCLDTTELYERQGRRVEDEDPTHVCIKPLKWWLDQLSEWEATDFRRPMMDHPESFLKRYDWDWFVMRKLCAS